MRAEIVSVGTELLLGQITDTNATFLAQSLADLGVDLFFVSQVGDNHGRLVDTLRRGWERSDLVITTGGVGPTEDDLTREAIADLVGERPRVDEATVEMIRAFFRNRNAEMPERNRKQAWLIPSAQALPNPVGTAPGWFVQREGKIIVAMPGVPREMKRMWEQEAIPRLGAYLPETVLLSRNLRTIGIGESSVEEVLGDLIHGTNPTVATYAKDDGVHVRITAKARTNEEAATLLKPVVAAAESILGDAIYGYDNDGLPEAVLSLATKRGETVALCEQGTGGVVTAALGAFLSAESPFRGGVTFEDGASPLLDAAGALGDAVRESATSENARLLASSARRLFGASYGLGVSVNVTEGSPKYGTVVCAVDVNGIVTDMTRGYRTLPTDIRRRAALWAIEYLRLALLERT
ncbi:MAG: CinA family nicotinamide mononucleotide deamidase-related protein [Thermomicrobiales bacterium]